MNDLNGKNAAQNFSVDHTFWQHDKSTARADGSIVEYSENEKVYRTLGEPAVDRALRGINSAIIAYGGVNTGKSHHMKGLHPSSDGLIFSTV